MSVLRIPADGERKSPIRRGKGTRRLHAVGPNVQRHGGGARDNRVDRALRDCRRTKPESAGPRLRAVPTAATPDEGRADKRKAQSAGRLVQLRDGRSPGVARRPRRAIPKTTPAVGESGASKALGVRALRAAFAALARPWSSWASSWEVFCFPPNGRRLSFNRETRCGRSPPESTALPARRGRSQTLHS